MEGEERELSVEEIRNRDLSPEQVFNGAPGSDSSRSFSCGNILEIVKHCVAYECRRVRAQPQSNSLNGEEGAEQDDFGYRKAHCFSSYYTVFVARLAIMVAMEMVELAQGIHVLLKNIQVTLPMLQRKMENIQVTLPMLQRKMDEIVKFFQASGMGVKTQREANPDTRNQ